MPLKQPTNEQEAYTYYLFHKFWQGEAGPLRAAGVLLDEELTEWNPDGIKALAYAAFIAGRATLPEALVKVFDNAPTVEEILGDEQLKMEDRDDERV